MNARTTVRSINAKIYFLCAASCLGLILAWLYRDSSSLSLLRLLTIWQAQTLVPIFIVIGVHMYLLRNTSVGRANKWLQLLISGLAGSAIFAPVGLLVDIFLGGEAIAIDGVAELLDEFFGVAPPVTFIWLMMNAPWIMGYRLVYETEQDRSNQLAANQVNSLPYSTTDGIEPARRADSADRDGEPPPVKARSEKIDSFYGAIPNEIGEDIIYMEAELHYLKVVTSRGKALILYNLKDAAKLLGSRDGHLCHRSFWVARGHITDFKKIGRGGELTLSNNVRIPVSKRRFSEFRNWYECQETA